MSTRRVFRSLVLAVLFAPLSAGLAAAHAQQGTITGRVTDAASGLPIPALQVSVVGTTLGSQTNAEGQYTIRGVNPGTVTVRALRVGFIEGRQTVVVPAGGTVTANFTMREAPITLSPVVTTATGEQRRVEVGNAIAQIDATDVVATKAVANMADLLTARAAGVMVIPGTQTGAGVRIRIRGTSSLSLSNNPIYIIDGVRMEGTTGSSSVSVGGTTPSRIGDLNPEEIETMEVIRGPSASTLYGTDAANGVIVITTKRGIAGAPRWSYYTEQTAITDRNDYPTAYRGWRTGPTSGTTSTASNAVQCLLSQVSAGQCSQDSVTSYNLHDDPEATPYGVGYRQQHGLQLRGGSEAVRYFLSGEWEDEDGPTKVPEFERRFLASRGLSLRPEEESPNRLTKVTGRANLNITLPRNADLAVSAGYITQDLRLPQSDDSGTDGIAANVYGGPGFKYNRNAAGDTLYGWRQYTPRHIYQQTTEQSIERFITSVSPNWSPVDWLALRGNFGLDYIQRQDIQICRFEECPDNGDNRLGFKRDNRTNFYTYTADAGATGTHRLSTLLVSKTSVGAQFTRNIFAGTATRGVGLPPGATTVTAGATQFASETNSESRTFGAYVEENLAIRDRLFLTAAVRSDRNSAFGRNFETAFYPKLAASWVVSDEEFFPAVPFINQLRLRTAYGASGVQPGNTAAIQYFLPTAATLAGESGDVPGLVLQAPGNPDLKPERSTEIEAGIDGTFWNNRINTELTYYDKSSKDALINRILPPSMGTGATARLENLGEVRNWGWEALVNAQLVQGDRFGWDVTLNGSTNSNELVSLGGVPPIVGATIQQREGYPLNGWWQRPLVGFEDRDGDGIIEYSADSAQSEITVGGERVFHGYSVPRHEVAFTNGFDFMQRRLRLSALMDYKGGHKVYNNTERIRCASRLNCAGLIDPASSDFEQARTLLVRVHPARSQAGFFEDGDFIRLREMSLAYTVPEQWAARYFRGRSAVATLAARNLGMLWTKYTGVDPEAFGTTGNSPSSFQAFGPPTYYTLRFTLGF